MTISRENILKRLKSGQEFNVFEYQAYSDTNFVFWNM